MDSSYDSCDVKWGADVVKRIKFSNYDIASDFYRADLGKGFFIERNFIKHFASCHEIQYLINVLVSAKLAIPSSPKNGDDFENFSGL